MCKKKFKKSVMPSLEDIYETLGETKKILSVLGASEEEEALLGEIMDEDQDEDVADVIVDGWKNLLDERGAILFEELHNLDLAAREKEGTLPVKLVRGKSANVNRWVEELADLKNRVVAMETKWKTFEENAEETRLKNEDADKKREEDEEKKAEADKKWKQAEENKEKDAGMKRKEDEEKKMSEEDEDMKKAEADKKFKEDEEKKKADANNNMKEDEDKKKAEPDQKRKQDPAKRRQEADDAATKAATPIAKRLRSSKDGDGGKGDDEVSRQVMDVVRDLIDVEDEDKKKANADKERKEAEEKQKAEADKNRKEDEEKKKAEADKNRKEDEDKKNAETDKKWKEDLGRKTRGADDAATKAATPIAKRLRSTNSKAGNGGKGDDQTIREVTDVGRDNQGEDVE